MAASRTSQPDAPSPTPGQTIITKQTQGEPNQYNISILQYPSSDRHSCRSQPKVETSSQLVSRPPTSPSNGTATLWGRSPDLPFPRPGAPSPTPGQTIITKQTQDAPNQSNISILEYPVATGTRAGPSPKSRQTLSLSLDRLHRHQTAPPPSGAGLQTCPSRDPTRPRLLRAKP